MIKKTDIKQFWADQAAGGQEPAAGRPPVTGTAGEPYDPAVDPLLANLNPEQRRAVLHLGSPLLILAGAGSGKTRVITQRIAWLVQRRGVDPRRILAITFTNKAANEMKERVSSQIGLAAGAAWVGTFHAMMLRILRQHAHLLGYDRSFSILDTVDQRRVLKEAMEKAKVSDKMVPIRQVQQQISSAKNKLIYPEEYAKEVGKDLQKQQLSEIYNYYQEELRQNNCLDFDDILALTVFLFEEQPQVLSYYQERFRHLLVDEYQDTNYAQYVLVRLLAAKHNNLFVVGDDDQSIYSFRGANLMNILDFSQDFPNCTVIRLEQNYRSTRTILAAANSVICLNEKRNHKTLWTEGEEGDKINFYRALDQNDEAVYVANQIRRLMSKSGAALSGNEIGVLYRVNALARNLESVLQDHGIAYRIYGGMRFYDRKEIKDIMAYLRLITQPADDLALRRIINSPRRGIGATTLELLNQIAAREQQPLFEICRRADEFPELSFAVGKIRLFVHLILDLQQVLTGNEIEFGFFVKQVTTDSGLRQEQTALLDKLPLEATTRIQNMDELVSDAMEFESRLTAELEELSQYPELQAEQGNLTLPLTLAQTAAAYLERVALYSDLDQADEADAVSLMTIHSAKGLEFDTVFLVGANEGLFPNEQSLYSRAEIEEERRLAYVALTRAKRRLFITATRQRLLYGQTMYQKVSRFAREIPDDLVEEEGGSRHGDQFEADSVSIATWSRRSEGARYGTGDSFRRDFTSVGTAGGTASMAGAGRRGAAFERTKNSPDRDEKRGLDYQQLAVGDQVRHERLGRGVIEKIVPFSGDAILEIKFKSGTKRFKASMSLLTRVED
ncbi:MAG: UvrD-helicase domain-containing protein [Clostridiaceae bacterium]|jgi:DNA helicase-2/ATP-dependent DNA helicase PcrA|nr:UvrD-helicase domain-containing protein [Clostridiaceae bacterium]